MIKSDEELRKVFENSVDIPEHLLSKWIKRLRDGEKGIEAHGFALCIINDFRKRDLLNKPQSPQTLRWLAESLGRILNHKYKRDAREVFSLPPRREGRPGDAQQAMDIACWVKFAVDRGYSEAQAHNLAAGMFHRDVKQIRRQHKRFHWYAEDINPKFDWKGYFLFKKRPLPPPS
jgi:hypothetical protein